MSTISYSSIEAIVAKLKTDFSAKPKKKADAIKFLADNKQAATTLIEALKKAWINKKEKIEEIGLQSVIKQVFTQNEEVKSLLLNPQNIKIIFYFSALSDEAKTKLGLKEIFLEQNKNSGVTVKLALDGAEVSVNKKPQTQITNSLFSYLLLNVPDLFNEVQINGFSSEDILSQEVVEGGKKFYIDLTTQISDFAAQNDCVLNPQAFGRKKSNSGLLDKIKSILPWSKTSEVPAEIKPAAFDSKLLEEKYSHDKWSEYKERLMFLGRVYQSYSMGDSCELTSLEFINKALQDPKKIYSSSFAQYVLNPKHLASIFSSNEDYSHNRGKFLELVDKIAKDKNSKEVGEYLFKRLKLLEFKTYKDCEIFEDWRLQERSNNYRQYLTQYFPGEFNEFTGKTRIFPKREVAIEKVSAFRANEDEKGKPVSQENGAQINCSILILNEFRKLLKGTKILGASFKNPYTGEEEVIPLNVEDLKPVHLQILARNEKGNSNGAMNSGLYNGLLSEDQVARLRCLVKATNISALVDVVASGGYPESKGKATKFSQANKFIVIDQAPLQWQKDFRNSGGMFFYPSDIVNDTKNGKLPHGYSKWQHDMFRALYNKARPKTASTNSLEVDWNGVKGVVDLNQVIMACAAEFRLSLESAANHSNSLNGEEKINFRFLKDGMNIFAADACMKDGNPIPSKLTGLENARIKGILHALKCISVLSVAEKKKALGKVKRIELPYSSENQDIIEITKLTKELGLEWGGTKGCDPLVPCPGYITATTSSGNCHALFGNMGGYSSYNAAMATNMDNPNDLNPAFNRQMESKTKLDVGGRVILRGMQEEQVKKILCYISPYLQPQLIKDVVVSPGILPQINIKFKEGVDIDFIQQGLEDFKFEGHETFDDGRFAFGKGLQFGVVRDFNRKNPATIQIIFCENRTEDATKTVELLEDFRKAHSQRYITYDKGYLHEDMRRLIESSIMNTAFYPQSPAMDLGIASPQYQRKDKSNVLDSPRLPIMAKQEEKPEVPLPRSSSSPNVAHYHINNQAAYERLYPSPYTNNANQESSQMAHKTAYDRIYPSPLVPTSTRKLLRSTSAAVFLHDRVYPSPLIHHSPLVKPITIASVQPLPIDLVQQYQLPNSNPLPEKSVPNNSPSNINHYHLSGAKINEKPSDYRAIKNYILDYKGERVQEIKENIDSEFKDLEKFKKGVEAQSLNPKPTTPYRSAGLEFKLEHPKKSNVECILKITNIHSHEVKRFFIKEPNNSNSDKTLVNDNMTLKNQYITEIYPNDRKKSVNISNIIKQFGEEKGYEQILAYFRREEIIKFKTYNLETKTYQTYWCDNSKNRAAIFIPNESRNGKPSLLSKLLERDDVIAKKAISSAINFSNINEFSTSKSSKNNHGNNSYHR